MINTFDRPGEASANEKYARAGAYKSGFTDKPWQRIPKAGAYAEAGFLEAKAEFSVFEECAKGPNASAGAEISPLGMKAMATAGPGTASANAGPIGVEVGLSLDTGMALGLEGEEVKIAGTGIKLGTETNVSVLGTEASYSIS